MKYIFLDIDGVLNTQDSWIRLYQINQALVKRLSQVVEKTNAKIVDISQVVEFLTSNLAKKNPNI